MLNHCPCGSHQPYTACCRPYFVGQKIPATAELLMRSRYTAFVKRQWNYLTKTMHGEAAQEFDIAAARKDALATQWLQLDVVRAEEVEDTAIVEFKAHFRYQKQLTVLHEVSHFAKIDGQWFYVKGYVQLPR